MAKADTSRISNLVLNCKICNSLYTRPKTLPCLHTFCAKCLERKFENNTMITCLQCKEQFDSHGKGADDFQTNYFLQNLTFLHNLKINEINLCNFCELKGLQTAALNICAQCRDCLCSICSSKHNLTRLTIDHRLIPLDKFRSSEFDFEIRQFQDLHCEAHEGECFKFYCTDCHKPICRGCLIEHRCHSYISVDEAIGKMKCDLIDFEKAMARKMEYFTFCDNKIDDETIALNKIEENLVDTIDEYTERIISKIRNENTKAKILIREETEQKKVELNLIRKELLERLVQVDDPSQLLKEIAENGKRDEILFMKKVFDEKNNALDEINFSLPDLQPLSLSVRFSGCMVDSDTDLFHISVTNLHSQRHHKEDMRFTTSEIESQYEKKEQIYQIKALIETKEEKQVKREQNQGRTINSTENQHKINVNEDIHQTTHREYGHTRENESEVDIKKTQELKDVECATCLTSDKDIEQSFDLSAMSSFSNIKLKVDLSFQSKLPSDSLSPNLSDVAWVSASTFVVTDTKNNNIKVFDDKGLLIRVESFDTPTYVAVMKEAVICSCINNIYILNENLISRIGNIYYGGHSKTILPFACTDHNVIVSRANAPDMLRYYKFDGKRDGYTDTKQPLNITFFIANSKKELFFSDRKKSEVVFLKSNGDKVRSYKPTEKGNWKPCGLCADSSDNIYVADQSNNLIVKLSHDLKKAKLISTEPYFCAPFALSWKNGRLLITDDSGSIWICRLTEECISLKSVAS